jgi:hypothetical protein
MEAEPTPILKGVFIDNDAFVTPTYEQETTRASQTKDHSRENYSP